MPAKGKIGFLYSFMNIPNRKGFYFIIPYYLWKFWQETGSGVADFY
jgi:hypothetical protein